MPKSRSSNSGNPLLPFVFTWAADAAIPCAPQKLSDKVNSAATIERIAQQMFCQGDSIELLGGDERLYGKSAEERLHGFGYALEVAVLPLSAVDDGGDGG